MDQESFRLLLEKGSGSATRTSSRSGPISSKSKAIVDSSQPVFKPRKIKKEKVVEATGKYRDRAAERREGGGNDYAHVEAILEDFERRNADSHIDKKTVEEQRKYLGGDGEHSILIKGLDMALLESNKARATKVLTSDDDDDLERTYQEAASTVAKKRNRDDIIRELKLKRTQASVGQLDVAESSTRAGNDSLELEEAKKQGKFKPIGFKPVGGYDEKERRKKAKAKGGEGTLKENGERKKKKRKVEEVKDVEAKPADVSVKAVPLLSATATKALQPEHLDEDFDIFAGAGDYVGIELDEEGEEGETSDSKPKQDPKTSSRTPPGGGGSKGWFEAADEEPPVPSESLPQSSKPKTRSSSPVPKHTSHNEAEREETQRGMQLGNEDEQEPVRLQPLEGSALPSIREFLAIDEAAGAAEKRRKRTEKKKAKGGNGGDGSGMSMEQKVNRDFQRLQSYTSKKDASGS